MSEPNLTQDNMQLNDEAPSCFIAPGKSLITEIEKLREAVLQLCELQRKLRRRLMGHSV